jgi:hypothetical protein
MAHKGKNHRLAFPKASAAQGATSPEPRPVALTLKVDDTYIRLCTLKATQRRRSQDILRDALHDYLQRMMRWHFLTRGVSSESAN